MATICVPDRQNRIADWCRMWWRGGWGLFSWDAPRKFCTPPPCIRWQTRSRSRFSFPVWFPAVPAKSCETWRQWYLDFWKERSNTQTDKQRIRIYRNRNIGLLLKTEIGENVKYQFIQTLITGRGSWWWWLSLNSSVQSKSESFPLTVSGVSGAVRVHPMLRSNLFPVFFLRLLHFFLPFFLFPDPNCAPRPLFLMALEPWSGLNSALRL